jgi:chromosome segregation protein
MHLKRLEMVGFKSFAERTRLEFEPGIIAVVGPNGCGKSNVVDALRWCLGEMSAKSLRSKVLLDVVFNGSANRAPSNLAEVSLTFDNSQNRLPIDFSEVTITRRLFRSGESEYFLNKTQCRLKDIKELFLDTGIGEEGYSIMEQGRVEYILNARPEERRELFEEAAGVSKYKARREEALRKMDRTQLDLDRLADVIAMTKEQMDKIEAAVRKARQYQKLQEDLKVMEITHWLWDLSQLDQELTAVKGELKSLEDSLQARVTQIDQREAELTELRYQEAQLGEKLVDLNRGVSEIDGSIGLAEQKQATAREREQEIAQRDAALETELAQGRARAEELERVKLEAQSALDAEKATSAELASALEREENAHAALVELQSRAEDAAKALQDALWANAQQNTRAHNDVAAQRSLETRLDTELKINEKDRAKTAESLAAQEAGVARFDADLKAREDVALRLASEADAGRAALEKIETELAAAVQAWQRAQAAYFECKAKLDAQAQWASGDAYAQGAQAILAAGLRGVHGPIGKLVSVAPADEAVVRGALGAHVNDLVADTLEDAQAALAFLSQQGKGRARFLVLDRLPNAEPSALTAVGQRPVLDMAQTDARFQPALKFLLGRWIASGTTLYGEGVLEGGAEFSTGPELFNQADAERRLAEASAQAAELDSRKQSLENDRRAAAEAWEKTRAAADTARVERDFFVQERAKGETQAELYREEIRLIDGELRRLGAERAQAEATIAGLEESLRGVAAEEQKLRAEWSALQETLRVRQSETSESAAALAVSRERAQSQQARLDWRQSQLSAAESELGALTASQKAREQERSTSQQRIDEQKRLQAQAAKDIEDLMSKRKEVESSLEGVHGERTSLHDRLTACQNALTEARDASEDLRSQLQDKKLQFNHAEFRRESTEGQLKEKYQLSALEAQERYQIPAQAVPQPELERLRRRVESLGAVNLAAPEEHAQLEERYNFLLSQQQDLLKAKEDLHQTIIKINATTREHFRETFEKVRENFKAIYGQLFQGGVADLRLTDEADMLNAGIEIFAQPPGKKLQNIALLSGGEKALTAVSLLFAFFMVRPAPFCVLDEVDAPLDEANVTRFITLIKAFTHQSQFLIITHNKRTMETADTLYGVTMETLGVSKILSARLKKGGGLEDARPPEAVIAGKTDGESAPA